MRRAIFLVGGQSSRFKGIVRNKCLLRLQGQTILERLILQTANMGVDDFVFVVGYAWSEVVTEAVRVLGRIPFRQQVFLLSDWRRQNGHALWLCRDYLNEECILCEGDVVVDHLAIPWAGHSTWFLVSGYDGQGSYAFPDNGYVKKQCISDTSPGEGWYKSAGIYYLAQGISELPDLQGIIDDVFSQMSMRTIALPVERWHEVDDVTDFEQAKAKIKEPVRYIVEPTVI